MNFKELFEGVEPKMPGAPGGIQIMTPQQFVAKAGDEKEVDETINMSDIMSAAEREKQRQEGKRVPLRNFLELAQMLKLNRVQLQGLTRKYPGFPKPIEGIRATNGSQTYYNPSDFKRWVISNGILDIVKAARQSMSEATKLPASSREFGGDEFQDYMKRIVGTPDTDKAGNVKVDKKGNEKYVTGKTKTDRYKMPYIHRSSVVEYLGPDGTTYDEDAVKKTLSQRPKALLKQNEKMKHSNGEFEQFFNVGFAALTGIALDEQTNKLIIVNTCPGAGSCKIDCFAMKGGKIQFKNAWQSDGRILTYLLNDPDGFFNQLSAEISKEEQAGQKGDKKFPKGWQTTIRWHDAGDFFSPEYLDLALKMAAKHPDTKFYAYTKMAGAALGQKPPNFIINWSEGAHTSQEKQVKASDANLDKTKNSRIVPDDLFQDLLVKDEKKNLVKGSEGQWQVQPDKLPELKNRLAKEYGLSANSILDYNQYMAKRKSIPAGMKYNVIVAPGEGDISANDPNIISTLLLKH
jgi:hypothetical protein